MNKFKHAKHLVQKLFAFGDPSLSKEIHHRIRPLLEPVFLVKRFAL